MLVACYEPVLESWISNATLWTFDRWPFKGMEAHRARLVQDLQALDVDFADVFGMANVVVHRFITNQCSERFGRQLADSS